MKDIILELDTLDYDLIFIDAPPTQGLADTKLLTVFCELVLFVNWIESSSKNEIIKNINSLRQVSKKNNVGVIANRTKKENLFMVIHITPTIVINFIITMVLMKRMKNQMLNQKLLITMINIISN